MFKIVSSLRYEGKSSQVVLEQLTAPKASSFLSITI